LISSLYSKTLFPSLKPLPGPASPKARCGSNYLAGPATQLAISAQQPHPLTLASLAAGQGPHVSHRLPFPSSSFLLRFVLWPVNPAGAPGRATRWARQPRGPHTEGRSARVGCWIRPREGAKTLMPRTARIRGRNKRPPRDPPAPSRRTARGIRGNPPRAACGLFSKGRQASVARTPSHQPLWGFPLATAPACTGLEEGGSAPPPRRAGKGRSREPDRSRDIYPAGTPSTRQGRRLQPPLVGRRGGRPRRGREPDRSRDIYIAGNAYFATPPPVLDPATTTLPPRREHHRSRFPLPSLLELFSV
jgi:hypothetical protein